MHHSDVQLLAGQALVAGGRLVRPGVIHWDIAGKCEAPFTTVYFARPEPKHPERYIVVGRNTPIPLEVEIMTPCRKCKRCLAIRAWGWALRARAEVRISHRTWFGTLTFRPEERVRLLNECRRKESMSGVDFDALPDAEQLALTHAKASADVTRMLKRIRKPFPPGALRYLVVLETHKDGALHYHVLLHEAFASHPVRHKALASEWPHGFSKWKLVEKDGAEKAASSYVTKYLTKSTLARIRASVDYGTGVLPTVG